MSNISVAGSDMSEFEAQFASPAVAPATKGQLRVQGWVIVLGASVVLWAGIAVGVTAVIHALN